ncbi:MAG: AI-2E family transporter [Chloroflexi bacterium]|nr:AI-2E family transporter [Chloroflexota bacterium]
MIEVNRFSQLNRFLIGSASFGVVLLIIQHFAGFIVTIIVAVILAILFTPFLSWLQNKGLPKAGAFILTLIVVILIMVGLFLFLLLSLNRLNAAVPVYAAELEDVKVQVQSLLASLGMDLSESQSLTGLMGPNDLANFVKQILSTLVGVLSDGITILLMLAFLLIGASSFSTKANQLIEQGNPGLSRLYKFNKDIRHYLLITNNVGLAAAAVNTIMLTLIGVDFALLWGVLSYLLSYIPYIGFLLALIPPALLALLEFGWPTAVFIVIAYFVINFAIDDVIKPRLMGEGLDLAPVIVFVSVLFWGLILGPLGGLLAVPVTVGMKQLVLEPDPDNRWIAELIGGDEAENEGDGKTAANR